MQESKQITTEQFNEVEEKALKIFNEQLDKTPELQEIFEVYEIGGYTKNEAIMLITDYLLQQL